MISGISLLLVAAIVVGVLWYLGHRSEPVKVAPVSMFMGWLSNESTQSGNVTADNLQKIYASDTQTVTALLVQGGPDRQEGETRCSAMTPHSPTFRSSGRRLRSRRTI